MLHWEGIGNRPFCAFWHQSRRAISYRYRDTGNFRNRALPEFRTRAATSKWRHSEIKITYSKSASNTLSDATPSIFSFKNGEKMKHPITDANFNKMAKFTKNYFFLFGSRTYYLTWIRGPSLCFARDTLVFRWFQLSGRMVTSPECRRKDTRRTSQAGSQFAASQLSWTAKDQITQHVDHVVWPPSASFAAYSAIRLSSDRLFD